MANQTVYPYGTNGSLPASVGIINDLTTGGSDKALSAERGKELNNSKLSTVYVPVPTCGQPSRTIINASTGKLVKNNYTWSSYIPVSPGDIYRITARDLAALVVQTTEFQSAANGADASIAAGGATSITAGQVAYITISSDAKYLCICENDAAKRTIKYPIIERSINATDLTDGSISIDSIDKIENTFETFVNSDSIAPSVLNGFDVVSGHKYLFYVKAYGDPGASLSFGLGGNAAIATVSSVQAQNGFRAIKTASSNNANSRVYITMNGLTAGVQIYVSITDLSAPSYTTTSYIKRIENKTLSAVVRDVEDFGVSWEYGTIDSETGENSNNWTNTSGGLDLYFRMRGFLPITEEPTNTAVLYEDKYSPVYQIKPYYYDINKSFIGTAFGSSVRYVRFVLYCFQYPLLDLDLTKLTLYFSGKKYIVGRSYLKSEVDGSIEYVNKAYGKLDQIKPSMVYTVIGNMSIVSGNNYKVYAKSSVNLSTPSTIKIGVGGNSASAQVSSADLFAGYTFNFTVNSTKEVSRIYIEITSSNSPTVPGEIELTVENLTNSAAIRTPYLKSSSISESSDGTNPRNMFEGNMYGSGINIVHCSDIHGDSVRWQRVSDFAATNGLLAIHTGDNITSAWSSSAWNFLSNSGVTNILNCIGNHDGRVGNDWWGATPKEVYDVMIAPYVSGWSVVQPENADENGLLYYYKDVTKNGYTIRFIVLDTHNINQNAGVKTVTEKIEGYTEAELTWLTNVLSSAKASGYHVVIANHYVLKGRADDIPTSWNEGGITGNFAETDPTGYGCINSDFVDAVSDFIDDGGHFICWLTGHVHCGLFTHASVDPRQLQITAPNACLPSFGGTHHLRSTLSDAQDDFNVISFMPNTGLIAMAKIGSGITERVLRQRTLVYDYINNRVIISD